MGKYDYGAEERSIALNIRKFQLDNRNGEPDRKK